MTDHRERLHAPLSWWAGTVAFAITWGWLFLVLLGPSAALIAGAIVFVAVGLLLLRYGSVAVVVDADGLRAGRSHLDPAFLGEVEPLDPEQYRHRLGAGADVRAHLVTRPFLNRGVLVRIDDPDDPTPYWLVSSRRPRELATALFTHRSTHEGNSRGEEEAEEVN
ncbi:DUF3093 domain-containing protein [Aeromicrobium sp. CF3.5]|uniref:DUF3093 domain-containing protein n=1 Tax=Aeromicrobium sp. CF3.5 TaxID=3373078 RepID=UPI003EE4CFD1